MFVYDADMEWDMGMPWYRPTRVIHATSGSEFGWRSGTGKWPAYYVDSLPPMVDIGPGSPVGVEFGYGAKFPAKYQKALYICDWTFGTHLRAPHRAERSDLQGDEGGVPQPHAAAADRLRSTGPTAPCTSPSAGASTQSELFRVTYVGKEPTDRSSTGTRGTPSSGSCGTSSRHCTSKADDPAKAVEFASRTSAHEDRFIRYAARVALEHQPVKSGRTGAGRDQAGRVA